MQMGRLSRLQPELLCGVVLLLLVPASPQCASEVSTDPASLLSVAASRRLPRERQKTVAVLDRNATISQMHIPKTAGLSLYKQLKPRGVNFRHVSSGFDERCYYVLRGEGDEHIAATFRNPLDHVYSLYLECSYTSFGRDMTLETDFPRDPEENLTSGYMPALSRWLEHFISEDSEEYYNCYHPLNMQVRYLTCNDSAYPEGGHRRLRNQTDDLTEAIANMRSLFFVGISEHYVASVCMLLYQLQLPMTNCDCADQSAFKSVHLRHGVPTHSSRVLSEDAKRKVAALTLRDQKLYEAAVEEFYARVAHVEARTGLSLFCAG